MTAYRELLAADVRQPKPLIAKELSISPSSTVGALLAEARQQGLLAAAVPGSSGISRAPARARLYSTCREWTAG